MSKLCVHPDIGIAVITVMVILSNSCRDIMQKIYAQLWHHHENKLMENNQQIELAWYHYELT